MYQRVRTAVRDALPAVEPPQVATGALHQQLLHAAAQRRPPQRGKLLTFARRVVAHPGYAAAAGLLLVGGAVGMQFARGRLLVPEPSLSAEAPARSPSAGAAC
jgi:hypothetical protein